jgi:glutaredoxin
MNTYLIIISLLVVIYYMWNQTIETCKIYWFYKDGCKYCKEMENEWELVENKLLSTSIKMIRIDANEPRNKKMRANFKIQTVPHIVKVFPNGTRSVYKGVRKFVDITEWAYDTTYDC